MTLTDTRDAPKDGSLTESLSEASDRLDGAGHERPVLVIRRTRGWQFPDLRELWAYRELIYFLTWRDVKVRYKQTAIGVAWAVIQPLAMVLVFTLFFGRLAEGWSAGAPYPLFVYAALLPWQLFSRTLTESTTSLVANQGLISRVYFPRVIVPLASTLSALVDFGVAAVLFIGMMLFYGITPPLSVVWLPVFVLLMLVTAVGVGLWLSALNVEYRDVAYTVPFLTQFWLFVTPVFYPISLVPEQWRALYGLNPMVGVVEGFRWALLGVGEGPSPTLAVSALVAVAGFVSGLVWFRQRERTFADTVGT